MTALSWAIAALLVALVLGIFLWMRSVAARKQAAPLQKREPESFVYELAREISLPDPGRPRAPVVELPRRYGQDRLVLMARDPHWLYAYWEISAAKQEDFAEQYGPAAWRTSRPVLRVYDVTGVPQFNGGNALSYVDIPLNEEAESWHIEVGQPDRSYCVDLGRILPSGEFVTLLRSNVAHTPRATLSDRLDEEWMWIEGVYRSLTRLPTGVSSPLVIEEMRERMGAVPLGISSPEFSTGRGKDN
jgi:hypothetical protein